MKYIYPDYNVLKYFTRKELMQYARDLNVKVGSNKKDTIYNIILSRKALTEVRLLVPTPKEEG